MNYSDTLIENNLYTDAAGKAALMADKKLVFDAFLVNFFGFLGLFKLSDSRGYLKTYETTEGKLMLQNIGDDNHDVSLSIKLAVEAGVLLSADASKLTRLLVLIKNKQVTQKTLDEQPIRDIASNIYSKHPSTQQVHDAMAEFTSGKIGLALLAKQLYAAVKNNKHLKPVTMEFRDLVMKGQYQPLFNTLAPGTPNTNTPAATTSTVPPADATQQPIATPKQAKQSFIQSIVKKEGPELYDRLINAKLTMDEADSILKEYGINSVSDIKNPKALFSYMKSNKDKFTTANWAFNDKIPNPDNIALVKILKNIVGSSSVIELIGIWISNTLDDLAVGTIDEKFDKLINFRFWYTKSIGTTYSNTVLLKTSKSTASSVPMIVKNKMLDDIRTYGSIQPTTINRIKQIQSYATLINPILAQNPDLHEIQLFLELKNTEFNVVIGLFGRVFNSMLNNDDAIRLILQYTSGSNDGRDISIDNGVITISKSLYNKVPEPIVKSIENKFKFRVMNLNIDKIVSELIMRINSDILVDFNNKVLHTDTIRLFDGVEKIQSIEDDLINNTRLLYNVIGFARYNNRNKEIWNSIINSYKSSDTREKELAAILLKALLKYCENGISNNSVNSDLLLLGANVYNNGILKSEFEDVIKKLENYDKLPDVLTTILVTTWSLDTITSDIRTMVKLVLRFIPGVAYKSIFVFNLLSVFFKDEFPVEPVPPGLNFFDSVHNVNIFFSSRGILGCYGRTDNIYTYEDVVDNLSRLKDSPLWENLGDMSFLNIEISIIFTLMGAIFGGKHETLVLEKARSKPEYITSFLSARLSSVFVNETQKKYKDFYKKIMNIYNEISTANGNIPSRYATGTYVFFNTASDAELEELVSTPDFARDFIHLSSNDAGYVIKFLVDFGIRMKSPNLIKNITSECDKILENVFIKSKSRAIENAGNIANKLLELDMNTANGVYEALPNTSLIKKEMVALIKSKVLRETLDIQGGVVKPLSNLSYDQLVPILKKNIDIPNVTMSGERAKKLDLVIKTIKDKWNKIRDVKLKVSPITIAGDVQEYYDRKTIEYDRFNNRKHGNTGLLVLEEFDVNFNTDEFDAFKLNETGSEIIKPAFHGTGSTAASMILRFGFKIIDKAVDGIAIVGRALGDGIYFTNVLDKASQYIGDKGYARDIGTIGYLLEMEAVLGGPSDYKFSGTRFISPEWAVFYPKKQLRIYKAYKVQMVHSDSISQLKNKYGIKNEAMMEIKTFKEFLRESTSTVYPYTSVYIFADGDVPVSRTDFKPMEEISQGMFSPNARLESSMYGIMVVINHNRPELDTKTFHIDVTQKFMDDMPDELDTFLELAYSLPKLDS